jgi:hypothetical protein
MGGGSVVSPRMDGRSCTIPVRLADDPILRPAKPQELLVLSEFVGSEGSQEGEHVIADRIGED